MQLLFHQQLETHLSSARLGAYTASSADGHPDPQGHVGALHAQRILM